MCRASPTPRAVTDLELMALECGKFWEIGESLGSVVNPLRDEYLTMIYSHEALC
jgi:hypothetical protein